MAFLTLRSMSISEKNAPVVEVPGYILYAQRVLAGDIVAGKWVRLACERFLLSWRMTGTNSAKERFGK